ncbi:Quercetin 2,3-dioxygenase [Enhygromyxa salina]|uniref:Quercetin 2,3-dioxygenase n=1 Tax=Enhygromyxa salina TaxID=215803 RepID=A0A2S9XR79_9BACT|nr:pirin family protein [Enhygromyxa salina]PRP95369.1 Quercetin 2,3-dioxygenase [Enhygromyxa salina]
MASRIDTATGPSLKPITHVLSPTERHWVGDGFAVSTIFSPSRLDAELLSPFILLDYGPPRRFEPAPKPRGVGPHPHRGFETVTFAYQGEVDHRDSHGGGGTIRAGDVQWMTAGSGVVHEEMQSDGFTRSGGMFEMVQLWVNLPARLKMTAPRYQALEDSSFPRLEFERGSGRLIAGTVHGMTGPGESHTPITLFDLTLPEAGLASFEPPVGMTTLALILDGRAIAQDTTEVRAGELVVLDRDEPGALTLSASEGARALVLSGAPLGEPVVAHGPFVMNTRAEISQAILDYQSGRMGELAPRA